MDIKSYLLHCKALVSSVHLYSEAVDKLTLLAYQRLNPTWLCNNDPTPYQAHLKGLDHTLDTPLSFLSVDTNVLTPLTDLRNHPVTVQKLIADSPVIHGTTSMGYRTYRDDFIDKLGDFGHQRLMGILYPYTGDFPVKNGTILYYDPTKVEFQEFSLIPELQQWIYTSLQRWTNSGYILSDPLYVAGLLGVLYTHMVSRVVSIRDKHMGTNQAHSFHIDAFLGDYGLTELTNILTIPQKQLLVRELPNLINTAGTHATYSFLCTLAEMDTRVAITEFTTRLSSNVDMVDIVGVTDSVSLPWSTVEIAGLTGQPEMRVIKSLHHGAVLDNLPTIKIQVRGNSHLYYDIKKLMYVMWAYLTTTGQYTESLPVKLPGGTSVYLTAKQALNYYSIHRPIDGTSMATELFNIYSLAQKVDGYSGLDIVTFPVVQSVDSSRFKDLVEEIYYTQLQLRVAIDVTPMSERVYWEGEFFRTYTTTVSYIPDTTQFLDELNLPVLTDEYLDILFDTFTGYNSTTQVVLGNKANAYKHMFERLVSNSTHITTDTQYTTQCGIIQQPTFTATKITPLT